MMNKTQTAQMKQINTENVLTTENTENTEKKPSFVIARGHPFQINEKKMTDATNMSSLTGFLFAIALFSSTNMSSLTGFLFADNYNNNAVIARSAATKQSLTIKAFSVRDCFAMLAMTVKGNTMTALVDFQFIIHN
jgi:hypothetical protein